MCEHSEVIFKRCAYSPSEFHGWDQEKYIYKLIKYHFNNLLYY